MRELETEKESKKQEAVGLWKPQDKFRESCGGTGGKEDKKKVEASTLNS